MAFFCCLQGFLVIATKFFVISPDLSSIPTSFVRESTSLRFTYKSSCDIYKFSVQINKLKARIYKLLAAIDNRLFIDNSLRVFYKFPCDIYRSQFNTYKVCS